MCGSAEVCATDARPDDAQATPTPRHQPALSIQHGHRPRHRTSVRINVAVALPGGGELFAGEYLLRALFDLTLLAGVFALALSGAAGTAPRARIGLGAAALGLVLFVVAELAAADALFAVAPLLTALGMVLAGVAVARERRWDGWRRWIPLVVGLWLIVVILPAIALDSEPPAVAAVCAIAGWHL